MSKARSFEVAVLSSGNALYIKRIPDGDAKLSASAARRVPYDARADYAPTGRAECKGCGTKIEKGALRLALMVQCDRGYKNDFVTHEACFFRHAETRKLGDVSEIHGLDKLAREDAERVRRTFVGGDWRGSAAGGAGTSGGEAARGRTPGAVKAKAHKRASSSGRGSASTAGARDGSKTEKGASDTSTGAAANGGAGTGKRRRAGK